MKAIEKFKRKTEFNLRNKSYNNNLRIISKPYPHIQTLNKTPVKFQNNLHKIVGGVAHTRRLPTSLVGTEVQPYRSTEVCQYGMWNTKEEATGNN